VHAALRRRGPVTPAGEPFDVVAVDGVAVDLQRHTVTVDSRQVVLTRKKFQVLALLAGARGAVCTRSRIVAEVWGRSWPGANRTLDVHVASLRTKLGRAELVQTVRGSATASAPRSEPVRARLLVIVLFLVSLLAAGLGIPLALADTQNAQLEVFTDRLADTVYFASIAERPITEADMTGWPPSSSATTRCTASP
jgi:hypothetical protein